MVEDGALVVAGTITSWPSSGNRGANAYKRVAVSQITPTNFTYASAPTSLQDALGAVLNGPGEHVI